MRLLSSPEYMHGAIERSFHGDRERRLWRLDGLGGQTCLLVLSRQKPDFASLVQQYGFPDRLPAWESKPYQMLLDQLHLGQTWRFRLKANPVRSVREGDARGKVMAHVTPAQQKQWLMERALKAGFILKEDGFEVVHTQWLRFYKNHGHQVTLRTAAYEGWLTIDNADLIKQTLLEGLGRAKAYGCGLLTLAADRRHG